jgi:predicted acetyltransferase
VAFGAGFFRRNEFRFFEPGRLIDRELELVEPSVWYIEPILQTIASPACEGDGCQLLSREFFLQQLERFPRGRERGNGNRVPAYTFWMRLRAEFAPPCPMGGAISLRVGHTADILKYFGHIGYSVYPPARGQHLAERSCRLLFPLARLHGFEELWITCNPDNIASRRTCERLGGEMVEIVDLPSDNPLYKIGERQKCRFRIAL